MSRRRLSHCFRFCWRRTLTLRFQTPAQLQQALVKVREALGSGSGLTSDEVRSVSAETTANVSERKPRKHSVRWVLAASLCFAIVLIAGYFLFDRHGFYLTGKLPEG